MIQLERDRNAIDDSFKDPHRRDHLLELFKAAKEERLDESATKDKVFAGSRWKKSKPQLAAETKGKCAFCETPTSAGYYGDVEHFRPKSVYWWLAYCYDNYLYSCRVCNGKKSKKHQLDGAAMSPPDLSGANDDAALIAIAQAASPDPTDHTGVASLMVATSAEESHLPDPYQVDGESLFTWQADDVLREVRLVARNPSNGTSQTASEAMEDIVDINRAELLYWRWQTYEHLVRLKEVMDTLPETSAKDALGDVLRGLTEPSKPYSAMSKYFLVEDWQLI